MRYPVDMRTKPRRDKDPVPKAKPDDKDKDAKYDDAGHPGGLPDLEHKTEGEDDH